MWKKDNSNFDLTQPFEPLFRFGATTSKSKKRSAAPWIDGFNFDNILLFDISHTSRRTQRSTFKITQSGIARCEDAFKRIDGFEAEDHSDEDENDFNVDGVGSDEEKSSDSSS